VLDINATDEIELNATLVDINANVEISGTATTTGVHTFTAVPVFPNNTVETADIQDDAITAAKIADNAVVTAGINADAVTGAKIADDAINSEHYTDGSIDTAHIADANVTAAKMFSGFANGITMADAWRTTANATFSSSGYITANWERADSDSYGGIGTGMSESSGVFTFPATGIYLVQAHLSMLLDGTRTYMGGNIEVTVNNSSYSAATELYNRGDNGHYVSVYLSFILDVSNTSNIKVKLRFEGSGSCDVLGNTNSSKTGMNFIRLGDT